MKSGLSKFNGKRAKTTLNGHLQREKTSSASQSSKSIDKTCAHLNKSSSVVEMRENEK